MSALVILTPRVNSHPFQERMIELEQPLKIGRSVAHSRTASNNAIFDCKVLSRNHALLFYEHGRFYLQDTKSSNGTFVNNVRLSKSLEDSLPTPLSSGDVLQFGVDVMEVPKKVAHGCIVATLQLFMPNGKEAKYTEEGRVDEVPVITQQDIYSLHQYLREASERERKLERKLLEMKRVLGNTSESLTSGWKSLIEEDKLLSRIDVLERQLEASRTVKSVGGSEEKLREEVIQLLQDKELYQEAAKEALRITVSHKVKAFKKCQDLEETLRIREEDYASLKERSCRLAMEVEGLELKYENSRQKYESLNVEMEDLILKFSHEIGNLNQKLQQKIEEELVVVPEEEIQNRPHVEEHPPPKQLVLTDRDGNDEKTMREIVPKTYEDASTMVEPEIPSLPSTDEHDQEVKNSRERIELLENEKVEVLQRLTTIQRLFTHFQNVSSKRSTWLHEKEMVKKVEIELHLLENFIIGRNDPKDDLHINNSQTPPPILRLSHTPKINLQRRHVKKFMRRSECHTENGQNIGHWIPTFLFTKITILTELLEEARHAVNVLTKETQGHKLALQRSTEDKIRMTELVMNFEHQSRLLSNLSAKNIELLKEASCLNHACALDWAN